MKKAEELRLIVTKMKSVFQIISETIQQCACKISIRQKAVYTPSQNDLLLSLLFFHFYIPFSRDFDPILAIYKFPVRTLDQLVKYLIACHFLKLWIQNFVTAILCILWDEIHAMYLISFTVSIFALIVVNSHKGLILVSPWIWFGASELELTRKINKNRFLFFLGGVVLFIYMYIYIKLLMVLLRNRRNDHHNHDAGHKRNS